ncbi:4808_t:CDS:2, partial [Entrophospora sp. SA101]
VVSIFGTIGGYYGIIGAFYIFLFGAGSISPWGFAHKGSGISKRLKKKTKEKLKKNKDHTLITIDDTNDHSKRLRDLEAFRILIEKNFIDASLIKPIEKVQKKK